MRHELYITCWPIQCLQPFRTRVTSRLLLVTSVFYFASPSSSAWLPSSSVTSHSSFLVRLISFLFVLVFIFFLSPSFLLVLRRSTYVPSSSSYSLSPRLLPEAIFSASFPPSSFSFPFHFSLLVLRFFHLGHFFFFSVVLMIFRISSSSPSSCSVWSPYFSLICSSHFSFFVISFLALLSFFFFLSFFLHDIAARRILILRIVLKEKQNDEKKFRKG